MCVHTVHGPTRKRKYSSPMRCTGTTAASISSVDPHAGDTLYTAVLFSEQVVYRAYDNITLLWFMAINKLPADGGGDGGLFD